jgi:hypothetical protein
LGSCAIGSAVSVAGFSVAMAARSQLRLVLSREES